VALSAAAVTPITTLAAPRIYALSALWALLQTTKPCFACYTSK
jgi:hypothetical protein